MMMLLLRFEVDDNGDDENRVGNDNEKVLERKMKTLTNIDFD